MDTYLSTKKAAIFCGYSHIYFARLMELYRIPRYGPKRNRFRVSDLENWMLQPDSYTPVEDFESEGTRNYRPVR